METNCEKGSLSSHDTAVLNKIFNPNLPFDDAVVGDATEASQPGS